MPTARSSPGLSTDGAHMNRVDSGAAACTGSAADSGQGVEGKVGEKRAYCVSQLTWRNLSLTPYSMKVHGRLALHYPVDGSSAE